MVECPECSAELDLAPDVEEAEIVVCPDCGVELEVGCDCLPGWCHRI
jgi:alpha-aminoadipate carrier protein LysW